MGKRRGGGGARPIWSPRSSGGGQAAQDTTVGDLIHEWLEPCRAASCPRPRPGATTGSSRPTSSRRSASVTPGSAEAGADWINLYLRTARAAAAGTGSTTVGGDGAAGYTRSSAGRCSKVSGGARISAQDHGRAGLAADVCGRRTLVPPDPADVVTPDPGGRGTTTPIFALLPPALRFTTGARRGELCEPPLV